MIDIKLYTVQGLIPVKKDAHGGNQLGWKTIYGQMNNTTFEYTSNHEQASLGDFNFQIPNCTVIYQAKQKENIVKIVQKTKSKSSQDPKYVELKADEDHPNDFGSLTNTIDERSKQPKEVGRALLCNMHSARGVSALSRGIEHSNYRGIVTILILLVLISNCRFIYKQFSSKGEALKEGVVLLLTHQGSFITIESVLWFLYANHWFVLCPAVSYLLEKFLGARASIPRSIFFCLVVLNLLYVLVFPIYYLQVYPTNAFAGMFYLMFSCIWFFKFWSYHHIWHDVRYHLIKANKFEDVGESKVDQTKTQKTHRRKVSISKEKLGDHLFLPGNLVDEIYLYPGNVTVEDVWMFCLIPTLCFQLEYPYYKKRNILGFIVRLLQCFFFIAVWITILSEVSLPITVDTVESFRKEDYWETVYYFFSLSAPNTYAWLIQFYLGFHCYLNAFAELTGFSDKNFYDDWWNSVTLDEYWRKWNLPMHYWLTRHIYFPIKRRKIGRGMAMGIVFAFSAFFHEYIVAGVTGRITGLGFNGMMCQLPIILIQDKYKKYITPEVGNAFFWIFFCIIGQPGGIVTLYYIMTS